MNPSQLQNHFDAFYEDFWCEMCKYGEIEEVVVCDNNNDRECDLFQTAQFGGTILTCHAERSHRQCLRTIQIRRLSATSLRCAELPVVCGTTYILRTFARHRFSRSVLPLEQWGRLCPRRVLQFHTQKRAECGARPRAGVGDEEVVEGEGKGSEEYEQESYARTHEEAVLNSWFKM